MMDGRDLDIKPIETAWNGYRFRSRLEARWAVFFDHLGLKYQYEPEGYDLDGIWYLPDFYIEDWDAFIEIKPTEPSEKDKEKCSRLSNIKNVFLFTGNPWPDEYEILLFNQGEPFLIRANALSLCLVCSGLGENGIIIHSFLSSLTFMIKIGTHKCKDTDCVVAYDTNNRMLNAFKAARSERFGR